MKGNNRSIGENVAVLLELVELQSKNIEDIKANMVTREEFDLRVSEHDGFRKDIDELKTHHERGHWPRKLAAHAFFILIGIGLALAFGVNPLEVL